MPKNCTINGHVVELQLISLEDGINHIDEPNRDDDTVIIDENLPVDKYGFYIEKLQDDHFHKSLQISSSVSRAREMKEKERAGKWFKMRAVWTLSSSQKKVKERCRKGIPNDAREWAWYNISNASRFSGIYPSVQDNPQQLPLVNSPKASTTHDDIERDIPRTFPRHQLFLVKNGQGQSSLRRILQCYADYDPEVGYCQGMGFIAGMFLTYMDEKRALSTFIAALSGPSNKGNFLPFKLREMYLPSMSGAQRCLYVFEQLGKRHLGSLWAHLEDQGMHPTMYATEWFMTMFSRGFSFDLVTRVWDVFLQEDFKIVYRVALASLKNAEIVLMQAQFEEIMGILRQLPEMTDAAQVMDLAWKVPISRNEIRKLEEEYEKQKHESIR